METLISCAKSNESSQASTSENALQLTSGICVTALFDSQSRLVFSFRTY